MRPSSSRSSRSASRAASSRSRSVPLQSGLSFSLPVSVLVVTNSVLVRYSQFLLGFYPGGPGTPALYAVDYAAVDLALSMPPFAAGYAAAFGVVRVRSGRANA